MDDKPKLTEKPGYFAIIPASVRYDKKLSSTAKLLYGEISCLLNFNNKCFASNAYFARLYELSEGQISRLISSLVNNGHIEITVENKPNGSCRLISMPLSIFINGGVRKNDEGGVRKNVKHNKNSINIISLSEDKDNALFIEFWNIFNNKKGLKEAFKSWMKLNVETHQLILKKLPQWLVQNADLFLPYPATWLNQERWNDEITAPIPKKPVVVDPDVYVPMVKPVNHQIFAKKP